MKHILSFILFVLTLTACSSSEKIDSGKIVEQSMESEEKSTLSLKVEANENRGQTQSNLQKLIEVKRSDEPKKEVLANHFIDMDYLVLVREEMGPFSEVQMPWYEYALLGGTNETYVKGVGCYNEVNLLYERWQVGRDFDKLKERYGEGRTNYYFRRHIIAFSPDAERILLKTYIEPPYGGDALYEIYERAHLYGSYIYQDTVIPDRINFTKGLQFATLDPVGYSKDKFPFYHIDSLSNYYSTQDAKQYYISTITDSNDTLYYKKDVNLQGDKCIGIYSILNDQLIFQSDFIESYPDMIDLLDNKLIVGFAEESNSTYLKYFEINMETNEAKYQFTDKKGSFSPDGKYFACPASTSGTQGYSIYSLETGETTYIISYVEDTQPAINITGKNYVCCWVRKDKVEELKKFVNQ